MCLLHVGRLQLGPLGLEGVGDVFQEDEPEGDVLVFRRLQIAAQLVRRPEQIRREAEIAVLPIVRRHTPPQKMLAGARFTAMAQTHAGAARTLLGRTRDDCIIFVSPGQPLFPPTRTRGAAAPEEMRFRQSIGTIPCITTLFGNDDSNITTKRPKSKRFP